jgi:hypothetical protein
MRQNYNPHPPSHHQSKFFYIALQYFIIYFLSTILFYKKLVFFLVVSFLSTHNLVKYHIYKNLNIIFVYSRIDYPEGPTLTFLKLSEKKGKKSYFLLADYNPKENKWTFLK